MKIRFISDTHFDHENIIRLAKRPFDNVDQMNETMINNWNSVVSDDDHVWHLGDFAWDRSKHFFDKLKGSKHFIKGNHDPFTTLSAGWKSVQDYKELAYGGYRIVLFHYPIHEWNGAYRGMIHLYGHVHGKDIGPTEPAFNTNSKRFDVGVESLGYFPRTIEEILSQSWKNV